MAGMKLAGTKTDALLDENSETQVANLNEIFQYELRDFSNASHHSC